MNDHISDVRRPSSSNADASEASTSPESGLALSVVPGANQRRDAQGASGGGGDGPPAPAAAAAVRPVFGGQNGPTILIHRNKSVAPYFDRTYDDLGQESSKQGSEQLPTRLQRYAKAHSRSLEMADFLDELAVRDDLPELKRRADLLGRCGAYLEFRHYFTVDQVRLHAADFCRQDKLCPLCAIRRGAKLLREYTARVVHLVGLCPELLPVFMTFTVKNGDDLGERFRHVTSCYGKLMQRRQNHAKGFRGWSEASRAWGGVGSVEVKRGRGSGQWHPHIHAVWLCESLPDQVELRREWKEISGDSHEIDVRPFNFVEFRHRATMENVAADFSEVFKYSLKFSSMSLGDNWHAASVLKGRRLIRGHGVLYGIEAPADLTDDRLDVKDLPFVELLVRYVGGVYC